MRHYTVRMNEISTWLDHAPHNSIIKYIMQIFTMAVNTYLYNNFQRKCSLKRCYDQNK